MPKNHPSSSPAEYAPAAALALLLCFPLVTSAQTLPATEPAAATSTAPATAPASPRARITAPKDPQTFLTEDELAQAFREKQYQLVVREAARIQQTRNIVQNYNQFDLAVLRAESQLRLRSLAAAMESLKDASRVATNEESRAVAAATLLLFQRQVAYIYTPKTPENVNPKPGERVLPAKAVDITDLAQRPAAFRALYRDELNAALQDLRRASQGESLIPIMNAAKTLDGLSLLEIAANGKAAEIPKMQEALFKRAGDLMAKNIKTSANTVSQISTAANLVKRTDLPMAGVDGRYIGTQTHFTRAGLTVGNVQTLREIINTTGKYAQAVKELAAALHQDPDPLAPMVLDATNINHDANDVLTADYTSEIAESTLHN